MQKLNTTVIHQERHLRLFRNDRNHKKNYSIAINGHFIGDWKQLTGAKLRLEKVKAYLDILDKNKHLKKQGKKLLSLDEFKNCHRLNYTVKYCHATLIYWDKNSNFSNTPFED